MGNVSVGTMSFYIFVSLACATWIAPNYVYNDFFLATVCYNWNSIEILIKLKVSMEGLIYAWKMEYCGCCCMMVNIHSRRSWSFIYFSTVRCKSCWCSLYLYLWVAHFHLLYYNVNMQRWKSWRWNTFSSCKYHLMCYHANQRCSIYI